MTAKSPDAQKVLVERRCFTFDATVTARLKRFARQQGVTLSIVVQGLWALVLNAETAAQQVTFGLTVAGRPLDLPGVEDMLGCFINNVPVRVSMSADTTLKDYFGELHRTQQRRSSFEYVSPRTIQRWSTQDESKPLFDHLLVWLAPTGSTAEDGIRQRALDGTLHTAYPLTLSIADGDDSLDLTYHLNTHYRPLLPMAELGDRWLAIIDAVCQGTGQEPLGALAGFTGNECFPKPVCSLAQTATQPAPKPKDAVNTGREASELAMLEDMLASHWQTVLDITSVNRDISFFESGGTSLTAAALHTRVEVSTRQNIPILSLFKAPSVRGMATTIATGDWPLKDGWTFPLKSTGDSAPLFCVSSPEVDTLGFALLAHHLPDQQPVYLLQAPPDSDRARRLSPYEIPELCARYIEAMKSVQPTGPYRLLGMCEGAHMTAEMAIQLASTSDQVTFAGVLDTWSFFTVSQRYRLKRVFAKLEYYQVRLRTIKALSWREKFHEVRAYVERRMGRPTPAQTNTVANDAPKPNVLTVTQHWVEDFGHPKNAPREPGFPGQIALIRTRPVPWWYFHEPHWWRVPSDQMGWNTQARHVQVETMQGVRHQDLLREPTVRDVAARVARRLNQCDASEGNNPCTKD